MVNNSKAINRDGSGHCVTFLVLTQSHNPDSLWVQAQAKAHWGQHGDVATSMRKVSHRAMNHVRSFQAGHGSPWLHDLCSLKAHEQRENLLFFSCSLCHICALRIWNKLGLEKRGKKARSTAKNFKAQASSGLKHGVLEERQLNYCTSAITAMKVETEVPS